MEPTFASLQRFPIDLKQIAEDEGGGWLARIPALGRLLFVGWGETPDKAIAKLNEVAEDLLEEYQEKGIELPNPPFDELEYSGKFVLRVPQFRHAALAELAAQEGMSLNATVNDLLAESLVRGRMEQEIADLKQEFVKLQRHISHEMNKLILASAGDSGWIDQSNQPNLQSPSLSKLSYFSRKVGS
jgi:predicted HicB family RNase H-like nuclease